MTAKQFHLGDVLSITDGRLMSPRHVEGLYEILKFMTGDSQYTHEIPRAMAECRPSLIQQFPQLDGLKFGPVTPENFKSVMEDLCAQHGEYLMVEPLPRDSDTASIKELSVMTQKELSDAPRNDPAPAFNVVDAVRRDHNQVSLETATPARASIPMTTEGLAQMRSAIETRVLSQEAVDNMFYQLQNPPRDPTAAELAARMMAKLTRSLVDDVRFAAGAIKTRVEFEALQPQTTKQKVSSVLMAINDGTSLFMASAKQSVQAFREEVAQQQANGLSPSPR